MNKSHSKLIIFNLQMYILLGFTAHLKSCYIPQSGTTVFYYIPIRASPQMCPFIPGDTFGLQLQVNLCLITIMISLAPDNLPIHIRLLDFLSARERTSLQQILGDTCTNNLPNIKPLNTKHAV